MRILVVHGPNLNLLGTRETEQYGTLSLTYINRQISRFAEENGIDVEIFQSNSEGSLVDRIQDAAHTAVDAIVINAAAYTHTSIAIRDAILAVNIPTVEVHLSNIYNRETFRQVSRISDIVVGQITGFGSQSYLLGMLGVIRHIEDKKVRSKEQDAATIDP